MACLVLVASAGTQGEMPHSKPPFWTTLFDGVGAQVEEGVGAVWGADEEVTGDAAEEAEVDIEEAAGKDTAVTADVGGVEDVNEDEEGGEDAEETADVAVDTGP